MGLLPLLRASDSILRRPVTDFSEKGVQMDAKHDKTPQGGRRDSQKAYPMRLHPLTDCAAGERRGQVEGAVVAVEEMGGGTE